MATWSEKKFPEPAKSETYKVKDFMRAKYVEKRFCKSNKVSDSEDDSEDSPRPKKKKADTKSKKRRRERRRAAKEESSDEVKEEEAKVENDESSDGEEFPAKAEKKVTNKRRLG